MDTVEAPRHMPRDASEVVIGILPKEIQRVLIGYSVIIVVSYNSRQLRMVSLFALNLQYLHMLYEEETLVKYVECCYTTNKGAKLSKIVIKSN